MAYPAVSPGPKPRPGAVTSAAVLLFVAAAMLAALSVVEFTAVARAGAAAERLYQGTEQEGFGTAFAVVLFGGAGVLDLSFALALVLVALFDLRGKQPARVMSWIFGGLAVLCCGCGSAVYSGAFFQNLPTGSTDGTDGPTNEELVKEMFSALPAWFVGAVLLLVGLLVASLLPAMILLMAPSANAYFRRAPETWLPPTDWYSGYPGGYPGEYPPGQPPAYPPLASGQPPREPLPPSGYPPGGSVPPGGSYPPLPGP